MEITEHKHRTTAWDRMDQGATGILEYWLPKWLVCKARGVIAGHEMVTPEHIEATEELAQKRFTEEQREYANRIYRDCPSGHPYTWPWPVPARVSGSDLALLILCLQHEDMSSPKAWAAVRLLSAAALIEASRRTLEDYCGMENA